jgi:hypothetical protein
MLVEFGGREWQVNPDVPVAGSGIGIGSKISWQPYRDRATTGVQFAFTGHA